MSQQETREERALKDNGSTNSVIHENEANT